MKRTFAIVATVFAMGLTLVAQQQDKSVPRKLDGMNLLRACDEPDLAAKAAAWPTPVLTAVTA
jgi:hypothetical protein